MAKKEALQQLVAEARIWDFLKTTEGRFKASEVLNAAAVDIESAPRETNLKGLPYHGPAVAPCRGCDIKQSATRGDHLDGCIVPALRAIAHAIVSGKSIDAAGKRHASAFMVFSGREDEPVEV